MKTLIALLNPTAYQEMFEPQVDENNLIQITPQSEGDVAAMMEEMREVFGDLLPLE